jgi:hypothetical protein
MPYFKNNNVNILFIHIPSIEVYFSSKFNIPLNNKSLFNLLKPEFTEYLTLNSSMQHLPYKVIFKNKKLFNINFNNIKIITIVRNPYERIISDLFYLSKITINASKEEVYNSRS